MNVRTVGRDFIRNGAATPARDLNHAAERAAIVRHPVPRSRCVACQPSGAVVTRSAVAEVLAVLEGNLEVLTRHED